MFPRNGRILSQKLLKSSKNGPPELGRDSSFFTKADDRKRQSSADVRLWNRESVFDSEVIQRQRYAAEKIHPSAAGMGNFIEAAMEAESPWVLPLIFSVLAFVCLVLFIDLRNLAGLYLRLFLSRVSVLITFGFLCWMNVGFSVLLFAVVPLLLGLGVDDGLHVVHRMMEEPDFGT